MSRDARIIRDFGDGTYSFRLGIGELVELQEQCDCGPWYLMAMFASLDKASLHPDPVKGLSPKHTSHIVRLGLIGGGMEPVTALKKVRHYVEQRPANEYLNLAFEVLVAALEGAPDEEVGEPDAGEQEIKSMISREGSADLPNSTELAQP